MSDLGNAPTLADIPAIPARGWTPAAKVRFLEFLALKGNVRAACAHVGLSAEAAYRLRRRDALFARGWAAAVVMARDHSTEVMACRALDGVEEPVFYRGEQVGTRTRYDTRLLLAHIARLDQMADNAAAQRDAGRFDELLAVLAGLPCPADLAGADGLPLPRDTVIARAVAAAERALFDGGEDDSGDAPDAGYADEPDEDGAGHGADDRRDLPLWQLEDEAYFAVRDAAMVEAAAQWDGWLDEARDRVDALGDAAPAIHHPRAGRDDNGAGNAAGEAANALKSAPDPVPLLTPCTVSTVSTSPPQDHAECPARKLLRHRM